MANVIAFFGIVLVCALCYPAWLVVIWRVLPAASRAQTHVAASPRACFWTGALLLGAIALLVLALVGAGSGPAQLLGWVIALAALGWSSVGAAAVAAWLGRASEAATGQSRAVLKGAALLQGAALLPVLGWVFVFPVSLCVALGAAARSGKVARAGGLASTVAVPSAGR